MSKNFVWHYDAAGEVFLKSKEIAEACENAAKRMTRATGMEYRFETGETSQRVIVEGRKGKDDE